MSVFIATGSALNAVIGYDDQRHRALDDSHMSNLGVEAIYNVFIYEPDAVEATYDFTTAWWPGGSGRIGCGGAFDDSGSNPTYGWSQPTWSTGGASGRFAYVGYTRDQYGSPIAFATVKCFRTLNDTLQATVQSDAMGFYRITTPYAEGHYLVVYKAGPPDICGTTVNSLLPS